MNTTGALSKRVRLAALAALLAGLLAACASPAPVVPSPAGLPSASEPAALPFVTSAASPGQHAYTSRSGDIRFLLYLPAEYGQDPHKSWPLLLYLHGSGEKGTDLQALTAQPLPETLEQETDFPFVVVSPQLGPDQETWSGMIPSLDKLLNELEQTLRVDRLRIYLTGLSLGGAGAWEFGLRYPGRFAALVPIAGFYRGDPNDICTLKDTPTWVFHGGQDTIVPPSASQDMVDVLKACGANVRLTLYPDADHIGSWRRAYAEPELYTWLLSQTLDCGCKH